ncbi:MAG: MBL fold metallo-hydrolase [Candidatus Aminicenantes bacterium]|nr:MBL fold metallo-hydrolase [Candidatus Aminicenantes bacterium]
MELIFWGVRGTVPVSGSQFNRFGGATTCSSIQPKKNTLFVMDAGTGIFQLSRSLKRQNAATHLDIHLLFTHFHLDHLFGLPFFEPLYDADTRITFYSFAPPEVTQKQLEGLTSGSLYPINFMDTRSEKHFRSYPEEGFELEGLRIETCPLHHPQGAVALKILGPGGSIVLATDTEHPNEEVDERLAAFAEQADALVCDATFSPIEYCRDRQGWGHSTWLEGTKLAGAASVKKLYLSHFNPEHEDGRIRRFIREARRHFKSTDGARPGLRHRL